MRRPNAEHLARPWKVHALAADFDLLDVWRFPVELSADQSLSDFLEFLRDVQGRFRDGRSPAAMLFRLRRGLGRLFGWDRPDPTTAGSDDAIGNPISGRTSFLGFDPIDVTDDEVLFELENATVHALMHIGRVPASGDLAGPGEGEAWAPELAVYVRRKGRLGRVYMALISPFRHYVVYPEMMRSVERAWPDEGADRSPPRT